MTIKDRISEIKKCSDFCSVAAKLQGIERQELSSRYITMVEREIKRVGGKPDIKVAYLTNFTVDLLPTYVNVYAAAEGLCSHGYVGAYNQYFQEVLNEDGPLYEFSPDISFIALTLKQYQPKIFNSFLSLTVQEKEDLLENIVNHVEDVITTASKRLKTSIMVSNFQLPPFAQGGISDVNSAYGEIQFYTNLNTKLGEFVRNNSSIHVFDTARLSARVGFENIYDPKMYYMAKIFWGEKFFPIVADEIIRYIIGIKGLSRKCLVLDLDNTLWGGIIGEDGPQGIKIGPGDPVGEAYLDFQYKIKSLKDRGIMLAICSKNNKEDVLEAFELRPEIPLNLSDFAATQINWDHKHLNIQRIARELNIGVDSLVFMDDNPAECRLIQQMLPEVKVVQLPANTEDLPGVIDRLAIFEKIVVLGDDAKKTEQYHQIKKRKELKESVGDLSAYLHSLETQISIRPPRGEDLNRVHQLFTKTNQFNVTTIRYSMGDIEKFLSDESWEIGIVSARDTFGDLGIIGLYLLEVCLPKVRIDSFILSCRAMGRGIESAVMNHIKERFSKNEQPCVLEASYEPTAKNKPVKTFFDQQLFEIAGSTQQGGKLYRLIPENLKPVECSWIKILD